MVVYLVLWMMSSGRYAFEYVVFNVSIVYAYEGGKIDELCIMGLERFMYLDVNGNVMSIEEVEW